MDNGDALTYLVDTIYTLLSLVVLLNSRGEAKHQGIRAQAEVDRARETQNQMRKEEGSSGPAGDVAALAIP